MIAINATSQVHLAKRIVPALVAAGSGRILFASVMFKFLPERVKAHRQARQARPN